MTNPLTVRVYGLLIVNNQILLSRENVKGHIITKFPGGGLEPQEGVIDCVKREFMEEVQISLARTEHFYTTEDYFTSAFHPDNRQVLSLYYRVWTNAVDKIKTGNPDDVTQLQTNDAQVLYWAPLPQLDKEPVKLPIDRIVVDKLMDSFK